MRRVDVDLDTYEFSIYPVLLGTNECFLADEIRRFVEVDKTAQSDVKWIVLSGDVRPVGHDARLDPARARSTGTDIVILARRHDHVP